MAFGIDDALTTAAAGISLTDTLVKTIKKYRGSSNVPDIERLIEEVRITAIDAIDRADQALSQFERTLVEKNVDLSSTLQSAIKQTPWWKPWEDHKLKRIRSSFNSLSDAAYGACDDISALLRCRDQTQQMGEEIVASSFSKYQFHQQILNSPSIQESINILRSQLKSYKESLT